MQYLPRESTTHHAKNNWRWNWYLSINNSNLKAIHFFKEVETNQVIANDQGLLLRKEWCIHCDSLYMRSFWNVTFLNMGLTIVPLNSDVAHHWCGSCFVLHCGFHRILKRSRSSLLVMATMLPRSARYGHKNFLVLVWGVYLSKRGI